MKRFKYYSISALLLASMMYVVTACSAYDVNDNPVNVPTPDPDVHAGFFSDEINRLIDENYPEVIANGYAKLVIPDRLYDQSIYPIADEHKRAMNAISAAGYLTYVNGGAVRDGILGTALHDVDFSTDATPEQMQAELQGYTKNVTPLSFSDHHAFMKKDVEQINETFSSLPSPKLIITTEKDETRLLQVKGLSKEVKSHLYVLPIKIQILLDQENTFNQTILSYVRKNSRNSILAKKPDDHKPKDSDRPGDRPRTISFRNI